MKNKLLAAVEDYLDDEREYVRFAEKEIQVLEQKARDTVRQTQRRMIAALYWRAGVLSAGGYLVPAVHIISMAQDMEAACAR